MSHAGDDKPKRIDPDVAALAQQVLIEEIQESRRRYHNILENVPVVVFELAPNRTVEYVNRTAELFGCAPDEIIGGDLADRFHPADRPAWSALFEMSEEQLEGSATPVLRVPRTGASARYVNARLQRMEDGRYVGSLDDVTVQRRIEADLLIAQRLDSIGDLAARTAHDFNNLLTVILGNINLAQRRLGRDEAGGKELDLAARACDRATALTSKMLHFSKDWEPNCRPSDLGQLVTEALDLCLSGSRIKPTLSIQEKLPPVEMDPAQIHQVINNLVLNAMDAMPEGGELHVEVARRDYSSQMGGATRSGVSVVLRDTGSGIPVEIRENIFEPFFTTKVDPEAGIGGEGLGLYSSFQIVKQHEGILELVASEPMEGTTFRISLPLAQGVTIEEEVVSQSPAVVRSRILVMDDDERVRGVLVAMLKLFGHEVVGVEDGEACIETFKAHRDDGRPFDLVITDLTVVAGRDGLWTAERLAQIAPEVPVLVASGSTTDPVMANPPEHGFTAALHKPFSIEEVDKVTNALLVRANSI